MWAKVNMAIQLFTISVRKRTFFVHFYFIELTSEKDDTLDMELQVRLEDIRLEDGGLWVDGNGTKSKYFFLCIVFIFIVLIKHLKCKYRKKSYSVIWQNPLHHWKLKSKETTHTIPTIHSSSLTNQTISHLVVHTMSMFLSFSNWLNFLEAWSPNDTLVNIIRVSVHNREFCHWIWMGE